MFSLIKKLKKRGVLSMNYRNAHFTLAVNPRRNYPLADDKLRTKKLAEKAQIQIPQLYGVIEFQKQCCEIDKITSDHNQFVIKPAHGTGGDGIIVIVGKRKNKYRRINGQLISLTELEHHVSNMLSGIYSLGGQPDYALIEYRVEFDETFASISYLGVPDVRIIVYFGVPVMAMVRLPTRKSDGKANLHQGAIGAGIDIRSGKTLKAVSGNEIVEEHPDTENPIEGVQVPHWHALLEIASRCYGLSGLGYLGVDMVIDKTLGPLLLEMNARPGLNIQIANNAGLLTRLNMINDHITQLSDTAQKIAFAQANFGVDVISGKRAEINKAAAVQIK